MRKVWTPIVIVLSITAVLGFFQNCTPAVPFGNTDHFLALVNSPVFPYEVGVDQVAYMSCAEQEDIPNDGTFFTFRVGSFDSHGVRITQEYRDHIRKVHPDDVPAALSQAQASAKSRIQLAARPVDNLQLMFLDQDNGDEGLDGFDYNYFFPTMGNEELNQLLWSLDYPSYMRTFAPALNIDNYRFEGELQFMKSERMEQDLRQFFNTGKGVLTVSFVGEGTIYPIGPGSLIELQQLANSGQSGNVDLTNPDFIGSDGSLGGDQTGVIDTGTGGTGGETDSSMKVQAAAMDVPVYSAASNNLYTNVFGVALKPGFKQPDFMGGNPGPDLPPRVLSSIQDVTIDERRRGELDGAWVCPQNMHFMIVLPEHAIYQDANSNTIVRCGMDPDPLIETLDTQSQLEWSVIRQSLYAEDFYVDRVRGCIVPKPDHTVAGSCYGKDDTTQQTHIINYDSFSTNGCGFGNVNGLCPHYASVCFRQ